MDIFYALLPSIAWIGVGFALAIYMTIRIARKTKKSPPASDHAEDDTEKKTAE